MSDYSIRPRFHHIIKGRKEQLEIQLYNVFKGNQKFFTTCMPGHLYVKVSEKDQHFWSPQLHVSYEQEADNIIIRGLYGPTPTLWAIFFFSYVSLGILSLFVGMWGFSRYNLGLSSEMLWLIPLFILIATVLYFAAQAGKKMGAEQMSDIHRFFENFIGSGISIQ